MPRNAGFVKGVRDQFALLYFSLAADQPRLLPICLETVMGLSRLQLQSEAVNVDVCPRTCPTEGDACCKYTRWFCRTSLQCAPSPRAPCQSSQSPAAAALSPRLPDFAVCNRPTQEHKHATRSAHLHQVSARFGG